MNYEPIGNRLFVREIKEEQVTASGFITTAVDKSKPSRGKVIAVGNGKRYDNGEVYPPSVNVGDEILFVPFGPLKLNIEGEEFLLLDEPLVLAKVK